MPMPTSAFRRMLILLLCLLAAAADAAPVADPPRVLFIGNSLTYYNDMPQMVARMAAGLGRPLVVASFTRGDYSLEEHLDDPGLERVLARGWDLLVLQQGPSSTPENRLHLIYHTQQMVLRAGSRAQRIALFAPWPQDIHRHTAAAALDSYHLAADAVGGCVLPVVSAWALHRQRPDAATLYDADGLHPTHDGSVLAALVILRGLSGPPRPPVDGVSDARLRLLDASAQAAYEGRPGECIPQYGPSDSALIPQPAEGYWSVPGAPGSGLFLQRQGDRIAAALFGYTAVAGSPSRADWWLGTGTRQGNELTLEAFGYRGGGCIECGAAAEPMAVAPPRRLRLRFESARRGWLAIDAGSDVPLTSLPFGADYEPRALPDIADASHAPMPLPRLGGDWMFAVDAGDGTLQSVQMRFQPQDGVDIGYRSSSGVLGCRPTASGHPAACTYVADDGSGSWRFALGNIEESRMQGETIGSGRRVVGHRLDDPAAVPVPFDGFWFDPQRPGNGLSLQRRGPLLAAMVYDFEPSPAASPRWRLAVGGVHAGGVEALLQVFAGGGCVGCATPAASTSVALPASMQLDIDAARSAWLRFDDGEPIRIVALPWAGDYIEAGSAELPLPDLRGNWLFGSTETAFDAFVAHLDALDSSPTTHRFSGATERGEQVLIDCPRLAGPGECIAMLSTPGGDVELGRFAIADIGGQRMLGRRDGVFGAVIGHRLD